jgi:hypothetical protein
MGDPFGTNGISAAATGLAQSRLAQEVGVLTLKLANDATQQMGDGIMQLINTVPDAAPQGNSGQRIDVKV